MKKLLCFLLFAFFLINSSIAQVDSCHLRITLITCAPGEELYSSFGHTAVRVENKSDGTDLFFNYGTFEFDDDFYVKFIKGQLDYFLSIQSKEDFMFQYEVENRWVDEQELLLSCNEKEKIVAALFENAKEENKFYRYDFLFDNCTTRAGRIIEKNIKSQVHFNNILPPEPPTFRNLIHEYLDKGHQYWSKLGIDILLGAKLDRKSSNDEAIHFLPDYLSKGFEHATVNEKPLVSPAKQIIEKGISFNFSFAPRPALILSVLAFIGLILLTWTRGKWKLVNSIFDFLLFFILGLAGLLLLFMWFGTDHTVTQNNYNLVWALPSHVVMAFFVHSRKQWVQKYFRIVLWINLLFLLTWFFLPQEMNPALIPVVLLIIGRSWGLSKIKNYGTARDNA